MQVTIGRKYWKIYFKIKVVGVGQPPDFWGQILYISYTDHAGLEIAVDSAVVLRTLKTEMLVPVQHRRPWEESVFSALPSDRDIFK